MPPSFKKNIKSKWSVEMANFLSKCENANNEQNMYIKPENHFPNLLPKFST